MNDIIINNITYTFAEEFDTNLCLSYENTTWTEWHVVRECLSNALDSVCMDTSKIDIRTEDGFIRIHDKGAGYPIVLAKRIGASTKKQDTSTIGQFGEGIKMSLLTCLRLNICVMLASMDWLIVPKAVELEGQQVLMYDIYKSSNNIEGSLVLLEATERIQDIINNVPRYFLHYTKGNILHGDSSSGIYPLIDGEGWLYNKGVFIKPIQSLYSYNISIEKLNRDRDLISYSDVAYRIRDIIETVNEPEIIESLIKVAVMPSSERDRYIEFYSGLYSNYPEVWAEVFKRLYGENVRLFTSDIACREAQQLGFRVVNVEYNVARILRRGGIKDDTYGLDDDYEFSFPSELNKDEKAVLDLLPMYAAVAGIEVPDNIKVFDQYASNNDIAGLYHPKNQQIYLRRDVLNDGLEKALNVFIHESVHHITGEDDMSRGFAEGLNKLLTSMILRYSRDVGLDCELSLCVKGVMLPEDIAITASNMVAVVVALDDEFTLKVGGRTIRAFLPAPCGKSAVWMRKVAIFKGRFVVPLPEEVKTAIGCADSIKCKIRI